MADLTSYLDQTMLDAATIRENTVKIESLRQKVPFNFLNFLSFEVRPNLNAKITNADNSVAAATVMSFNAEGIEQSRGSITEFPISKLPIIHSRGMLEEEILNLEHSLSLVSDPSSIILKQMYDDVTANKSAVWERFEIMFLQLMSNEGIMTMNTTNNVDGIVKVIDYNIDSTHTIQAAVKWATSATATPIVDIQGMVDDANELGYFPDTLFMSKTQFHLMLATSSFKAFATSTIGSGSTSGLIGLKQVNEIFELVGLPQIYIIVDATKVVNSSGVKVAANAWDTHFVSLGTTGELGTVAIATPPTSLYQNKTDVVFSVDENGLMNIVKSSLDPMTIKTTAKTFGIPVVPKIYDMFYLEMDF